VYEDRIRIAEETAQICRHFDIDPLQLIASGSLLIAVEHDHADHVVNVLEQDGIAAAVIGDLVPTPGTRLIRRRDGTTEELVRPVADHLWKALETQ
jgi:hydrogenase expression/formation protein HypE